MDFVKVMGIARRFYFNHGMPVATPKWFDDAFDFCTLPDSTHYETAQRELLAWAEQHPEKPKCEYDPGGKCDYMNTGCGDCVWKYKALHPEHPEQTKEEKTVDTGSKRTIVHEMMMVEPNEPVDLVYVRPDGTENVHFENVVFDDNGYLYDQNKKILSMFNFADIINGLLKVRRRPTLTDEQRDVLVWLDKGGFKFVAMDGTNGNNVYTYEKTPVIRGDNEYWVAGCTENDSFEAIKLQCLRPILPDWTKPLDIKATLKEAHT